MVADLKVSHDILSQKIFEIQFKNNYWKEGIIEPHTEKENLKGTIDHLQDENRTQNKINSELEMEITEIKTLFKASESEELIKTKSSLLQILKEIKNRSTAKDDYESVKTIGTNTSHPELNKEVQHPTAPVESHQSVK